MNRPSPLLQQRLPHWTPQEVRGRASGDATAIAGHSSWSGCPEPERAVRARLARGVRQVLIQWKGEPPFSTTWEDIDTFVEHHPTFQLEDELLLQGERCHVGPAVHQQEPCAHISSRRSSLKVRISFLVCFPVCWAKTLFIQL